MHRYIGLGIGIGDIGVFFNIGVGIGIGSFVPILHRYYGLIEYHTLLVKKSFLHKKLYKIS
jgi:hypothetical protein